MSHARGLLATAVVLAAALPVGAHDGTAHARPEGAAAHAAAPLPPPLPFPFAIGGDFALTDQAGHARTAADPDGRLQLLFFGYANCQSICSVALPAMAETVDLLAAQGVAAVPVMITVDPARDTVATMAEPLAALHPAFVGLTGGEDALAAAYDAFGVEISLVFEDPEYGPVYAHGSHVYLLDPAGEVLTLLPPILGPARMAEIAAGYAALSD